MQEEQQPETVTVLEANYDAARDQVVWQVERKNGDILPMIWTMDGYKEFTNVSGYIPPDVLQRHFEDLRGKQKPLIIKESNEVDRLRRPSL
jgi:hypothetical protein